MLQSALDKCGPLFETSGFDIQEDTGAALRHLIIIVIFLSSSRPNLAQLPDFASPTQQHPCG